MLRPIISIGITVAVIYAALCIGLFFFQRSLIYFPQPRSYGHADTVAILRTPDATLALTVRPVPGEKSLIYFGGNAEDVSASLPDLSAAFPDRALYLLHYRGYGGSTGKPSEAALHADALALFDKVYAEHPDVTVIGRSLGSGVAVRLAGMRPVSRLVLVTPYNSIQELAIRQFPYMPVRWLLQDKFESWRYASRVQAPTTLVVAEHDEVIPAESARRLHAYFPKGVARYELVRDVGHNTISDSPNYLKIVNGTQ
jgi:pimeloyl-ACP methyl ester carboxylesterase